VIEDSAVSRAYALLRAKGLLPGGTPGGRQHAAVRSYRPGAERVIVDKSERMLYLFKAGKAYKEYRISLGGFPKGPKLKRGDLRTPEGVYTLDWRNPRSRYYKSIHISYPNDQDRIRAEQLGVDPGGDIMLHGEHYLPALKRTIRRAQSQKDWTEGCIALNNEFMDEIWQEVADGTPIEIRP
jgi:murein L,D-transpeptidase YafK